MLRTVPRLLLIALTLGAAVAAGTGSAAHAGDGNGPSAPPKTGRVVVRPVTASGTAADGFTVRRVSGPASCEDQAATAVDPGIDICFPSALYVPSCWKSSNHTVLCLRNVTDTRLVRVRYSGTFVRHAAVRRPSPQGLRLTNGAVCGIRVGGAWGQAPGHPDWVGFYSCSNGAVYGPPDGDGVDRSHAQWRVHVLRADGTVVTRTVATATYVGTAS